MRIFFLPNITKKKKEENGLDLFKYWDCSYFSVEFKYNQDIDKTTPDFLKLKRFCMFARSR